MSHLSQALRRAARLAAFAAALVALAPAVSAQPKPSAAAVAEAQKLITLTGAANLFTPLDRRRGRAGENALPPAKSGARKGFQRGRGQIAHRSHAALSELSNEMATLYATEFTEQELKEIVTFYQSPVGKKLLDGSRSSSIDSMKFAQDWANKLSDEVIGKIRDEMKKKGHQL